MDNNLINIDDLVRQRLGGVEEQERSGAWLRMQELLEQDTRRRPFAYFNWKRVLTFGGLFLLLGLATVGTYEVRTGYRALGPSGEATGGASGGSSATIAGVAGATVANQNGHDNRQKSNVSAIAAMGTPVASANEQASGKTNNSSSVSEYGNPLTNNRNESTLHGRQVNPARDAQKQTNATGNTSNTIKKEANQRVAKEPMHGSSQLNPLATMNSNVKNSVSGVQQMESLHLSGNRNTQDRAVAASQSAAVATAQPQTATTHNRTPEVLTMNQLPLASSGNTLPVIGIRSAGIVSMIPPAAKPTGVTPVKASPQTPHRVYEKDKATEYVDNAASPIANSTPSAANSAPSVATINGKKPHRSVDLGFSAKSKLKLPKASALNIFGSGKAGADVASGSSVGDTQNAGGNLKVEDDDKYNLRIHSTRKHAPAANGTPTAKPLGASSPEQTNTSEQATGKQGTEPSAKQKATKLVTNVKLRQSTKGTYGRKQTQIDTTSVETEAIDLADANPTNTATGNGRNADTSEPVDEHLYAASGAAASKNGKAVAPKPVTAKAKKTAPSAKATPEAPNQSNPTATNSTTAEPTAVAKVIPAVVPPAKAKADSNMASASATATTDAKAATAVKKKKGSRFFENLSAAFNDVKYKLSGAQFAPGLTAGINSTFFGPTSFRGFQFGFSGNFEIDEKWSFMTELKYFHRANSNFAMYDIYVDYAANDSITNTYSFSTLHSFELPFSLRYTYKKFDFFGGGNLLYTMRVNTGPAPLSYAGGNVPFAPGYSTKPELSEKDFSSRFGVGYLFGCAYKASPNVTIDFRSVQTVWDNSSSAGSKKVSAQIYKSPSLQFSILYRLGAKGRKD